MKGSLNRTNMKFINETLNHSANDAFLDLKGMTNLMENANHTLRGYGVNLEDPDCMKNIFRDETTSNIYIDSLAEGLEGKDLQDFKALSKNMMDNINGRGSFAGKSILQSLTEDNTSASFLPKAKVLFPMFRFTWPRLVAKEFCTVMPMDAPEVVKYFFKAIAKNTDGSITPLPSYSPIGGGRQIGTYAEPKNVPLPGSLDLLASIGYSNTNSALEKRFLIVGWAGIDPTGANISDKNADHVLYVAVDEDGKFQFTINVDPLETQVNPVVEVISGFVDFAKGIINVSGSRSDQANGRVTSINTVCSATSAEYNVASRIVFDNKRVEFRALDTQLQSEWSEQYVYDMNKRTGMDIISELVSIMGNQAQLTVDKSIIDNIIWRVGTYGDNIRQFYTDPKKVRSGFAYTKKEWANELLFSLEKVSARIYTGTNVMEASHILCNPEDLVWLQMLNNFNFNGDYSTDGSYGKSNVGTVNNGKTVLCSPLVPQGYMVLGAKPSDVTLANYIYAPYVPFTISPYPLGNMPAVTFTVRYAHEIIRPEGFGVVRLV